MISLGMEMRDFGHNKSMKYFNTHILFILELIAFGMSYQRFSAECIFCFIIVSMITTSKGLPSLPLFKTRVKHKI